MEALPSGFNPLVADWFISRYGAPTPIQDLAWPRIIAGEHILFTAPTGSGKTLTAFLAAINEFVTGRRETGVTSVLYVSPLKALNNDIRRNLLVPLGELAALARERGVPFPNITVATRSGDTPRNERQRMLRRPPEILITTPESLNIILTSPRARAILATVRTLILDEIHAVVATKRGTHLMTAVERLGLLAGEFQRIAVSATVKPLDTVARFVGGFRQTGDGVDATYTPRDVAIVEAPRSKRIELTVDFPDTDEALAPGSATGLWPHLVRELTAIIERNRSTLIFVTTRRHAEKLTLLLNEGRSEPVAYAHHGSLSRELRVFVERALKDGRLRAIVATNSLELGIDIGALDEVVMVKTPPAVSSTLQRVGRAGHRVGATSRGRLYPLYGRDMIDAAAMTAAALSDDIEEVRPVEAPLDVLAQVIVAMSAMERWGIDALFAVVRRCWSYHTLERRLFDLVIEMLAGRYADTRIRELRPRLIVDRVAGELAARDGATALLYQSGGTIPDRGYFGMRLDGGGPIGELDEEFVWERRVGESFVFGSQAWTITGITDRDVLVTPAAPGAPLIPFWRAEARGRDVHYSRRLLDFLEACEDAMSDGVIDEFLAGHSWLEPRARTGIVDVIQRQREATGHPLPHRHHVVIERVLGAPRARADDDQQEVIIHSGWGGRVNEPLSIALAALWEREHGYPLEVFADNDCLMLLLPNDFRVEDAFGPAQCRTLLRSGAIEELLRERLERSGRFGAIFRENAGRALLLPKGGFNRRMPLWLTRLRSKKLLGSIAGLPDFPILLETWRTCLYDEFDLPALRELLEEVANGEIAISACETETPSPFAAEAVWQQKSVYMYRDDAQPGAGRSALSDELIRQAVHSEALRPRIPRPILRDVETRLQRLAPGYAPAGATELVEWVTERLAIPSDELEVLEDAVVRDHGVDAWRVDGLEDRLLWIEHAGAALLVAKNRLPALAALFPDARARPVAGAWSRPSIEAPIGTLGELAPQSEGESADPAAVLLDLLRFYGPVPISGSGTRFGLMQPDWEALLGALQEEDLVVVGTLTEDAPPGMLEACDAENLEYLLRRKRVAERPSFEPVDPGALVPLWSETTLLESDRSDPDALVEVLDRLFGFVAPAASWEGDLLPARLDGYYPLWLDGLFAEHELIWFGAGRERIGFALASEAQLFRAPDAAGGDPSPATVALRAEGPCDFATLRDRLNVGSELVEAIWNSAWRGEVSNDTYAVLRRGIETKFTASSEARSEASRGWPGRRSGRSYREWRATRPLDGTWFALPDDEESDPIVASERSRERARVLLRRYGIVFRDLVVRESDAFSWAEIFRTLRLMELGGEVVSGLFVRSLPTPQFALRSSLGALVSAAASTRVVWMSAVDPASPCGLSLGGRLGELPPRAAGTHLVFRGGTLVMVSRRSGRELAISVDPDDPDLVAILAPLRHLVGRRWNPLPRVVVERVNDEPVRESAFAPALRAAGFRDEFKHYVLSAGYR